MPWIGAAITAGAGYLMSRQGDKGGQQQQQYSQAMYDQTRSDLEPWRNAGELSLDKLQYMLGLSPGGAGGSGPGERPTPQQFQRQPPMARNQYVNKATAGSSHYAYSNIAAEAGAEWDALYGNMGQDPGAYNEAVANWEKQNAAWQQQQQAAGGDPEYGSLTRRFSMADFEESPGYNYRLERGREAINKGSASRGNYYAPQTLQDLGDFQQGIASDEFEKAYGRYTNDQDRTYGMLANQSVVGQNAAAQTGAAGSNSISGYNMGAANSANARIAGISGIANAGLDAYNSYKQQEILKQNQDPTYGAST